jgi:sarcosine oxidase subunit gamma
MTRVAGVSCSILLREIRGIAAFQLWLDGTYGAYLWHTLEGIVRELGGAPIGLASLFPELSPTIDP